MFVGTLDITNKNVRLRNGDNLKVFVQKHIIPGSSITYDGYLGYNFLDFEDSVWPHESHNHGNGDLGLAHIL